MPIAPLPGPNGLYNVSVMPQFLLDSQRAGWQGAYFTYIDAAADGRVDHEHRRACIHRSMQRFMRRDVGARQWHERAAGFSVWRDGDEQHFDWRQGGRSQFLFLAPELTESLLGAPRALPALGQSKPERLHMMALIFDALEADLAQGSPAGPLVGESLIAALLAHVGGLREVKVLAPAQRSCARAIDFIETHFSRTVTLQELADAAGLGQRQLCRAFRDATGLSPHRYLLRCRIEHAKRLIAAGQALVDVALHCGFADQSQLSRTFARLVGTSPGRYRASAGRGSPVLTKRAGDDKTSLV